MRGIWKQLQRVQDAFVSGNPDTQDGAIAALQDYLETSCCVLFPSFLYPQFIKFLQYYCSDVLPGLDMEEKDHQWVGDDFLRTIERLQVQEEMSRKLERQFHQFFLQLKSGTFASVQELLTSLWTIIDDHPERVPGLLIPKPIEKTFRGLSRSAFTSARIQPFFNTLIPDMLPGAVREKFFEIQQVFWHQLQDFLHMKAVLVNSLTQDAQITCLDVRTELSPSGIDELNFKSTIDDDMLQSCWTVVQVARSFLEDYFPYTIKARFLNVTCRFANPMARYRDASASLLVGLKVVGDVLDMEIDPTVLVSGAVDKSGHIMPVDHVAAKIAAADRTRDIRRLYLPYDGTVRLPRRVTIKPVHTFAEAVEEYYGPELRKKRWQLSRRKLLKGLAASVGLLLMPTGTVTVYKFLTPSENPVTGHDWDLFECARGLYQSKSDYQSASRIFSSLLGRLTQESPTPDLVKFQASVFGELGVMALQQNKKGQSFNTLCKALKLWTSLEDRENQADILLRIGEVYRYTVAMDGNVANTQRGLLYYQQARDLLHPSMPFYRRLQGRCDSWTGHLLYWSGEYDAAERYCQEGVAAFDEPESNWSYQTARQHLGKSLIKVGKYDQAHDILSEMLSSPILQSPYYRARTLWSLSDLYFTLGQREQALVCARETDTLCHTFALQSQYRLLRQLLRNHEATEEI